MLVFSVIGCQPAERPEDKSGEQAEGGKQQGEVKAPPIPKEINQGDRVEPTVKVYMTDTGTIKEIKFEEYLEGVLAGEMHNDWPEEALQAQAIIARTFVMEFITDKGGSKYEGADVSTDIEEAQAWDAEQINDRIKAAVKNTRGKVIVYDDKFVKAWFHAHAGGKTATAKEGLGFEDAEPPYIQVVESPDSEEAPPEDAQWKETFTKAEIIAAAKEQGHEIGNFNAIEIAEKGPSGRATKLKIGDKVVAAPAFRVALDSTRMKSTLLTNVVVAGDKVTMEGAGYGHGVGMSQWGAYQMAKDGKSPEEIIKHYFKDVEVVKLFD